MHGSFAIYRMDDGRRQLCITDDEGILYWLEIDPAEWEELGKLFTSKARYATVARATGGKLKEFADHRGMVEITTESP